MKYAIKRLVKKDTRHVFIDLWNEENTSNVELTVTFNKIVALNIFYEMLSDHMQNDDEITLLDVFALYSYWGGKYGKTNGIR